MDYLRSAVVVVSFPQGRNVSRQRLRQLGLIHDRWRHHISPPPQFRYGTGGEGNIPQPPVPVVSAATTLKTFGLTDFSSTYSMYAQRAFGGIEPRRSGLESDTLTTRLPMDHEIISASSSSVNPTPLAHADNQREGYLRGCPHKLPEPEIGWTIFYPNFEGEHPGGAQRPPTSLPLPPTSREDLRLEGYLE
ncbi:uncharacterized protein TNCV_4351621 [Trichonephila clavipes]|nr:uncharacterized protein TNCV_4351621 [Trichonephila clavipes]